MPLVNREWSLSQKSAASSGHCSEMVPLPSRGCKRPQPYRFLCLCQRARNPAVTLLPRDSESIHKRCRLKVPPPYSPHLSTCGRAAKSPSHRPTSLKSHLFRSHARRHLPHSLCKCAKLCLINTHAVQKCSVHI